MKTGCSLARCKFAGAILLASYFLPAASQLGAQDKDAPKLEDPSAAAVASYSDAANLQNNRRYELAAMDWEKFLKNYPNTTLTPQAEHYAGVCWLQIQKFGKAAPHFEAVVNKWRKVPKFALGEDAFLNLGWCKYQLADASQADRSKLFASAAAVFLKSMKEYPKGKYADQILYFLGDSLYLQSEALTGEAMAPQAGWKGGGIRGEAEASEEAEAIEPCALKAVCRRPPEIVDAGQRRVRARRGIRGDFELRQRCEDV